MMLLVLVLVLLVLVLRTMLLSGGSIGRWWFRRMLGLLVFRVDVSMFALDGIALRRSYGITDSLLGKARLSLMKLCVMYVNMKARSFLECLLQQKVWAMIPKLRKRYVRKFVYTLQYRYYMES
jgi:hypothetical protein